MNDRDNNGEEGATVPVAGMGESELYELLKLRAITEVKESVLRWALVGLSALGGLGALGLIAFFPTYVTDTVKSEISSVIKDQIEPELVRVKDSRDDLLKASGELLEKSRQSVNAAQGALKDLNNRADTTLQNLKIQADQSRTKIEAEARRLEIETKRLLNAVADIALKLRSADEQQKEFVKSLERSRSALERDFAALSLRFSNLETKTAPAVRIVQALEAQVKSGGELSKRESAATALGQYGEEAKTALETLRDIVTKIGPVELESPELAFLNAVCIAIVRIGGEAEVSFLLDHLVGPETAYPNATAIVEGLSILTPVTASFVRKLQGAFQTAETGILKELILRALYFGVRQKEFDSQNTRSLVRDLLVEALSNETTFQTAAYEIRDNYADIGKPALDVLRVWQQKPNLSDILREAAGSAIKAIEAH